MPQTETFWNPYRWVREPSDDAPQTPRYRQRFDGAAGRIDCRLTALTPLLIGDGHRADQNTIYFYYRRRREDIVIPGTSLKGAIRSLAETISGSAEPRNKRAEGGEYGKSWRLDTVARMFGYLEKERAFAGSINFSDGEVDLENLPLPWTQWPVYKVVVGSPKREHASFYPRQSRKFYHHHTETDSVKTAPSSITQTTQIRPAPPGASFTFSVCFEQLSPEELSLLLYSLVLEEQARVTLGPAAAGGEQSHELHGPLRHKIGGCKSLGAGSVRIEIERVRWMENPADRYRGRGDWETLSGEPLAVWVQKKIEPYIQRQDASMQELRAMTIYDPQDPRAGHLAYPSYAWFEAERGQPNKVPLKPTL